MFLHTNLIRKNSQHDGYVDELPYFVDIFHEKGGE